MAVLNNLVFGILILQIYVNAAPSDVSKLEEIATTKKVDEKLDPIKEVEDSASSIKTVREKRFYNPFAYGFPPLNPPVYPDFNKRDDFGNTANFGIEDPLTQIHRHVQEIASFVRQPQPPRIPHVPIFYPLLYVPSLGCNCNPNNYQPPDEPSDQSTDEPIDRPTEPSTGQPGNQPNYPGTFNEDQPDETNITTRFSPMDDERQIWGVFVNKTGDTRKRNQARPEFSRPISFDPIRLNQPTSRPSPPVEHGTLQSDVTANQVPSRPQTDRSPQPTSSSRPTTTTARPTLGRNTPPPVKPQNGNPVGPLTACDEATITCCHRPIITYDCFARQGCPNSYGNPCEVNTILRTLERLQRFYFSRSG